MEQVGQLFTGDSIQVSLQYLKQLYKPNSERWKTKWSVHNYTISQLSRKIRTNGNWKKSNTCNIAHWFDELKSAVSGKLPQANFSAELHGPLW